MSLAKDLLERGETEAVLAYFELCRVFWKMGGSRLDAWSHEVQAGRVSVRTSTTERSNSSAPEFSALYLPGPAPGSANATT